MTRFVNPMEVWEKIVDRFRQWKQTDGLLGTTEAAYVADTTEGMLDEINQLRHFRAGAFKSAKEILAASMNIGNLQSEETYALICAEIDAIAESIEKFHEGVVDEVRILDDRLTRRFDPSMAWNEAINRAIERKQTTRDTMFTTYQSAAFAVQQRTTKNALRNA